MHDVMLFMKYMEHRLMIHRLMIHRLMIDRQMTLLIAHRIDGIRMNKAKI